MSLDFAAEHLTAAVRLLATSERPLPERLQSAWDEHVQMLWMKPCLTIDLLRDFKDLWERNTAASDDPRATTLNAMSHDDVVHAVDDVVALATRTAVAAAHAPPDMTLATLADLA